MEFVELLARIKPGDAGFAALVALAVWSIYTGRLIPKISHEREVAQYRAALERSEQESDSRGAALTASETARMAQSEQLGDMLEIGRTTIALLESIKREAEKNGGLG